MARLVELRIEDRRDAVIGFVTLLGVMTAHSILETARDTLFLTELPARQLPWAYIAIAGLTLLATSFNRAALSRLSRRRALASCLAAGGAVTAAFFAVVKLEVPAALFGLYVWTGLLATVVVVQFWLLAAQVFDVGQAKRVFAFIAAGGLIGAVTGSALSGVLLMWLSPVHLLLVSGGVFVATAVVPVRLSTARLPMPAPRRHRPRHGAWPLVGKDPYLRRVFWSIFLSAIVFTGVDFVFKAMVSVDVAPDQLGLFFARFYAVMNLSALVVQLVIAPRILRLAGVSGSLLLLPTLLLAGSIGFIVTLGLGAVLVLRAADGALRHSLYRTSTEILYLPLASHLRDRFKAIAESLGQRGGQAIASLAILGAVALEARPVHLAIGLCAVSFLWFGVLRGLKPHYLDLFRRNLREGALSNHADVPELDLHSLEALIGALSSDNDYEVIGSLDMLASYGRTNLIPALILYHPSPEVVLHAFELFSGSVRPDVKRLTARLLKHPNPRIRAAALRVHAEQQPDRELLDTMMEDGAPIVRATAMVQKIRAGFVDEWAGGDALRAIIDGPSPEMRQALAYAARDLPPGRYAWALVRLAGVREPGLSIAVARSMAAAPDFEFLPTLIRMLADRDCRDAARTAVVSLGDDALDELEQALSDEALPRSVRRHLPRTISRFVGNRAARMLMRQLAKEKDEVVVLKILRGLGRMRDTDPSIRIGRKQLILHAEQTLTRVVQLLSWRIGLEGACQKAGMLTPATELLAALLADKEASAIERVFRLLQIIDPREEFRIMYASLRSADRRVRAESRELLSNVVPESMRTGLLALVEDGTDVQRIKAAGTFYAPPGRDEVLRINAELDSPDESVVARAKAALVPLHERALREMLNDDNDALRSVASYCVAELGGAKPEELLVDMDEGPERAFAELSGRVRRMSRRGVPEASGAQ